MKVDYKRGAAWGPGHKHCIGFEQTWRYGEVALKYKWSRRVFRNKNSSKLTLKCSQLLRTSQKLTGMASVQATPPFIVHA